MGAREPTCSLPLHLLAGGGAEEEDPGSGLRAAPEHKGFPQGGVQPDLGPLQSDGVQGPLLAFVL